MIRDPSDGSVKPDPISSGLGGSVPRRRETLETKALCDGKPVLGAGDSGLPPTSAKAAYLARLEASREWLKDYAARPVETIEGDAK